MEGRKALTNGRLDLQQLGREGNNENDISAVFCNTWEGTSSAITPIGVYEVPDEDTDKFGR
eukprot:7080656-Ditylum_brightwellii.AAC.1